MRVHAKPHLEEDENVWKRWNIVSVVWRRLQVGSPERGASSRTPPRRRHDMAGWAPLCVHGASLLSVSHLVCKAEHRRVTRHWVAVVFVFSQIFLTCVCACACVRQHVQCMPQGLLCCKRYPHHLQQYCLFLFSVTLFIMDSIKHYSCVRQPPSLPLLLTPVIPPLSFNLKPQRLLLHSPVACPWRPTLTLAPTPASLPLRGLTFKKPL